VPRALRPSTSLISMFRNIETSCASSTSWPSARRLAWTATRFTPCRLADEVLDAGFDMPKRNRRLRSYDWHKTRASAAAHCAARLSSLPEVRRALLPVACCCFHPFWWSTYPASWCDNCMHSGSHQASDDRLRYHALVIAYIAFSCCIFSASRWRQIVRVYLQTMLLSVTVQQTRVLTSMFDCG
jgi:hypothetical protein